LRVNSLTSYSFIETEYSKFETYSFQSDTITDQSKELKYPDISFTPLLLNSESQWSLYSLSQLYNSLKRLNESDIVNLLKKSVESVEVIEYITKTEFLDIKKLATLVLWVENLLNVNVMDIGIVEDPETQKIQFITIQFKDCDWEAWKILSKCIKKQLIEEGFSDVAERVTIVCNQKERLRKRKDLQRIKEALARNIALERKVEGWHSVEEIRKWREERE